jgi:hypothetical protein
MDKEMRNRDTLRYCVSLMKDIQKTQRSVEKRKALEFVINKLNAGIQRSYDRSSSMQAEV